MTSDDGSSSNLSTIILLKTNPEYRISEYFKHICSFLFKVRTYKGVKY